MYFVDVRCKNKFWGKSMEIVPIGTTHVNLPGLVFATSFTLRLHTQTHTAAVMSIKRQYLQVSMLVFISST